ncbi:hypothetical protein R3P38DRAFT_2802824 [Favolaschia claudopus]|uniref:Uncharacterized protein n=1 Tax=Favolaschia claudopus TaxID=2862362 RepID=A0AAV9ZU68_9AGAR
MVKTDDLKPCRICQHPCKPRGLKNHENACANKVKDGKFAAKIKSQQLSKLIWAHNVPGPFNAQAHPEPGNAEPLTKPSEYLDFHLEDPIDDTETRDDNPVLDPPPQIPAPTPEIKRVYHPHTKRAPEFQSFNVYLTSNIAERRPPVDPHPWQPFRSQLDFEVAEFCEQNMLNKHSTTTLLSLIRRFISTPTEFTLANPSNLDKLWDLASHKCTAFEHGTVIVNYNKEDKMFDTYVRPLWDWALNLIQDPGLASSFVWDPEKFNGDSYIRFYHEPWTADAFWNAQSALPDDPAAKPLCFVIYADKSKLSTFGTQKAYAVVARLANIRVGIQNSTGFGGGQVVGHQPIVPDDPNERDKPKFANFKNIVWHAALYKLLESIVDISKVGHWTKCGDDVLRWLWPLVLILAADYEEACVMALFRGLRGLYPCPICFVPAQEQSDLSAEHPLRTAEGSKKILDEACALRTKEEQEEHLKAHGMRNVENSFGKVRGSDVHRAISGDPLHADENGMFDDHIFVQLKARVEALGRAAVVKIDSQMASFPRWRNLKHFATVMNTSFNDGSKNEDIAKTILFVAHSVLKDEAGLLLLKALRCYLEYRTALSAEVHTAETIADGEKEVQLFNSAMQVCTNIRLNELAHTQQEYIAICDGTEYENVADGQDDDSSSSSSEEESDDEESSSEEEDDEGEEEDEDELPEVISIPVKRRRKGRKKRSKRKKTSEPEPDHDEAPPPREIEIKIAVFTPEQMKKAKSSRGAAAADVFSLLSDQPWNTLQTRISAQIITVIKPAILKLDDYNITFTIPRRVSDPMRLVDRTNCWENG